MISGMKVDLPSCLGGDFSGGEFNIFPAETELDDLYHTLAAGNGRGCCGGQLPGPTEGTDKRAQEAPSLQGLIALAG